MVLYKFITDLHMPFLICSVYVYVKVYYSCSCMGKEIFIGTVGSRSGQIQAQRQ